MLRKLTIIGLAWSLMLTAGAIAVSAQSIAPARNYENYDQTKIDRYLDVEVWTGHSDGEYYEGDNVVIHFRANRDAFVALYSVDTRGRVNLLFPTYPGEDNFVNGGVTYKLPGGVDDYDLVVSGPEGFEHIQILASRERFPIPDWFRGPELVDDWDDRPEFMDWVNSEHFVRYHGQRFAYDRAVIYVNEWEDDYFRPIYRPSYPSWTVYGNAYIDYPWGASVYVNGIYWGCTPLYVPRIAVGWHTISLYDHYGHCWEHDFHVSRYNTVVFNRTIIQTSSSVRSKYKDVRVAGYRNPVKHGYPNFESRRKSKGGSSANGSGGVSKRSRNGTSKVKGSQTTVGSIPKKYVRGSAKVVKTDRGYETDASTAVFPSKKRRRQGSTDRTYRTGTNESSRSSSKGKASGGTSRIGQSGSGRKTSKSPGSSGSLDQGRRSSGKRGSSTVTRRKSGTNSPQRRSSNPRKMNPVVKKTPKAAKPKVSSPSKAKAPKKTKVTKKESKPAPKAVDKPVEKKSKPPAKKKSDPPKGKKSGKNGRR